MPLTFEAVRDAALELNADERESLLQILDESIDGPPDAYADMTEEEFVAELDRRHDEAMRDPSVLISSADMFERLYKRVNGDH